MTVALYTENSPRLPVSLGEFHGYSGTLRRALQSDPLFDAYRDPLGRTTPPRTVPVCGGFFIERKTTRQTRASVETMVKNRKAPCKNRIKLSRTQRRHEGKVLFRKIRRTPGFIGSSFWITAGKSIVDRVELGLHGGIGRDVADAGLLCTDLGQVEIFAEAADLVCVGA